MVFQKEESPTERGENEYWKRNPNPHLKSMRPSTKKRENSKTPSTRRDVRSCIEEAEEQISAIAKENNAFPSDVADGRSNYSVESGSVNSESREETQDTQSSTNNGAENADMSGRYMGSAYCRESLQYKKSRGDVRHYDNVLDDVLVILITKGNHPEAISATAKLKDKIEDVRLPAFVCFQSVGILGLVFYNPYRKSTQVNW